MKRLEAIILTLGIASTYLSCDNDKMNDVPEECHLRCNVAVPAYCGPLDSV